MACESYCSVQVVLAPTIENGFGRMILIIVGNWLAGDWLVAGGWLVG